MMNAEVNNSLVLRGKHKHYDNDNSNKQLNHENIECETTDKHSATWTSRATFLLLELYETELQSLETARKKKKIWQEVSNKLKNCNIHVTPDQVRWKINALTKKYKRCLESRSSCKFKYFNVMEQIYSKFNMHDSSYTVSELLDNDNDVLKYSPNTSMKTESKAIIELRKMRLANRLESDRAQTKIQIEKQWLEYLNRQEQSRQRRDRSMDSYIKLKEQELEIKKRKLELRQSIELKNIKLMEKDFSELLQTEREKCDVLKLFV